MNQYSPLNFTIPLFKERFQLLVYMEDMTRNDFTVDSTAVSMNEGEEEEETVASKKRKFEEISDAYTNEEDSNSKSGKFELNEEAAEFEVQKQQCVELCASNRSLNKCRECHVRSTKAENCRFVGWRKLKKVVKKGKAVYTMHDFLLVEDVTLDDCKLWLPQTAAVDSKQHAYQCLSYENAKMIFRCTQEKFLAMVDFEEKMKSRHHDMSDANTKQYWKKPMVGTRELCDQCDTSIFNGHFFCTSCGFAVCLECFDLRERNKKLRVEDLDKRNQDKNQWYYCTSKTNNGIHLPSSLKFTQFIPPHIINKLKRDCNKYLRVFGKLDVVDEKQEDAGYTFYGPKRFLSIDARSINTAAFNREWSKKHTILVRNVHANLVKDLWTPESFSNDFGDLVVDLVNCKNHQVIKDVRMRSFWLGFENSESRLADKKDQPMILKLKDWPPAEDFKTLLPTRFDDLMNNLPVSEYTKRDSVFNLVSNLPDYFLAPDLGPKMYIAYSSADTPKAGTTNLHVDISDAVNVMLYVGVDRANATTTTTMTNDENVESPLSPTVHSKGKKKKKKKKQQHKSVRPKDQIYEILKQTRCDAKQMERYTNGEKVGAIWHIFLPQDADRIRTFLVMLDIEKNKPILEDHDPIHDQTHYIDQHMLVRLKEECDVEGFVIIQYLGDAVFIPAGAPHQVRNINSCIKVAEDFVTPQGIDQCFLLTDQFRKLPDSHSNHEDKLQVKNILYHSIKECASVISRHIRAEFRDYNSDDGENDIEFRESDERNLLRI